MTKMRNGWEDDVRINSLQHENSISRTQLTNIPAAEKSESLYDFGISTNRPISAPLPSGIGLDLFKGLDDWRSGYTESIEPNSASVYKDADGMKSVDDVLNMPSFSKGLSAPSAAKFTPHYPHGNSIPRPKSAAPQLNGTFFSNQNMKENKVSVDVADSLFRDFEIMNVGSRRAASTGVIEDGELSSSSYSSVRDVPLGLSSLDKSTGNEKLASYMDVIEENIPVKPLSRGFQSDESDTSRVAAEFNFNQVSYQKVTPHGNTMHKPQEKQYSHRGGDGSSSHLPGHPQNQMKYGSPSHMMTGTTHNALNHMSHVPQSPNASHPMYVQPSAAHNPFVQSQGMQYYDLHQMDSITAAQQGISYMQPQRVRNDGRSLSDAYGNPTFGGGGGVAGGGYPSVQYHHPLSPQYNHPPSILPHDPNMMNSNPATISHAQPFFTAIPVQGAIPASSTGAFIYFHPTDISPVQSQTYSIINGSGLNGNSVPVSPPRLQNTAGRTSHKKPTLRHVIVEQNGRKSSRNNSRKSGNTTSFDSSKHASLSSGALSLLEEYRSSKDRFWTAKDVKGHIVEFCLDQNGSRFIQQRLEIANVAEKYLIASEVLPSVEGLRNDVFGNYVVQKLFENCNTDVKLKLKNSLEGHMVNLSSQVYGCRVVQKALEKLGDDDLIDLLSEFHSHALSCIHDQNGNHVIQKIIEVVSTRCKIYQAEDKSKAIMFSAELDFILDCVTKNVVSLSCHPFGCRVMQRILEHCIESQRAATLDCIQKHLRTLMDDQYGNYVIQHVLQFGRKSDRDIVIEIIVENGILELSRQKFASNVIEKLLKYGNSNHRNTIIREMLKLVEDKSMEEGQSSIVLLMVRDAYANYVVQTTLDVAPEGIEKKLLLEELKSNAAKLRNYTFAKHIITKLEEAESKGMRHKFG